MNNIHPIKIKIIFLVTLCGFNHGVYYNVSMNGLSDALNLGARIFHHYLSVVNRECEMNK